MSVENIGIVQINRTEDLLHTLIACSHFRKEYPQFQLHLIARKQFAKPIYPLLKKYFNSIHLLDLKEISNPKHQENLRPIFSALQNLDVFLASINQLNLKLCLNFSFSKSSSFLMSLIQTPRKMGLLRDQFAHEKITDIWSQYIHSCYRRQTNNPFHPVDLYKKILGARNTPPASPKNIATGIISIAPQGCDRKDQWSPAKWIEIIYQILKQKNDCQIKILQTGDENEIIEAIINAPSLKRFSHRIQSYHHALGSAELISILEKSQLLISANSEILSLSSITQTASLGIFLAHNSPTTSAPYLTNTLLISPRANCFPCLKAEDCDHLSCHRDIPADLIQTLTMAYLDGKDISPQFLQQEISPLSLGSANIHCGQKASWGNELMPIDLTNNPLNSSHAFALIYRITWSYLLEEIEIDTPFPIISENTKQTLINYQEGLHSLYELCEFGAKYSEYAVKESQQNSASMEKIQDYSQKLGEIDQLALMLKSKFSNLSPLIDFFHLIKANIPGNTILELAQSSLITYHDYSNAVRITDELCKSILSKNGVQS